jgi:hypothetical protein
MEQRQYDVSILAGNVRVCLGGYTYFEYLHAGHRAYVI